MNAKYAVGQRVIVTDENLCGSIHTGYYGSVESVELPHASRNRFRQPLYHVQLTGRHGAEPMPWMLAEPSYAFFEAELEATD